MKKFLFVLAILSIACAQEIPKPTGHVNDFAGILSREMAERLETKLRAYKAETTNEVSVVTVRSLEGMSVEDYTVRLAKAWGVGNKKKDNGVVFLVAPKERKCRIEVGYGLEPKLTDIQAKRIIESVIIPEFKAKRMAEGIEKGTEAILSTLTGKAAPAAPSAPDEGVSGGWALMTILLVLVVIVLIGLAIAALSDHSSVPEWSSSTSSSSVDLGPIAAGAAIGSVLASTPRPRPRRYEAEEEEEGDDDDDSRSYRRSYDSDNDSDSSSSFGGFGGGSFGGGGASGSW